MNLPDVVAVLEALADGANPLTGEVLPEKSACNHPHVIRALFTAARELRRLQTEPPAASPRPAKAWQPWTTAEDQQLRAEFAAKIPIPEIARRHQRTRVAMVARLMRLGLVRPYASAGSVVARRDMGAGPEDEAKQRARAGRVWTPEEDAALLQEYDAGQSIEELAKRLQRGEHAINVRLWKLGRGMDNVAGAATNQEPQPTGAAMSAPQDPTTPKVTPASTRTPP